MTMAITVAEALAALKDMDQETASREIAILEGENDRDKAAIRRRKRMIGLIRKFSVSPREDSPRGSGSDRQPSPTENKIRLILAKHGPMDQAAIVQCVGVPLGLVAASLARCKAVQRRVDQKWELVPATKG